MNIYLLLLINLISLTIAVNYRTFNQQIWTGTYTIPFVNNQTYTITFAPARPTSAHYSGISFDQIQHAFCNTAPNKGRFSAVLSIISSSSTTTMIFSFATLLPTSQIASARARYIVVETSFPYLYVVNLVQDYSLLAIPYNTMARVISVNTWFQLDPSDIIKPFLSGFDTQSTNPVPREISLVISCLYLSSNVIRLSFMQDSSATSFNSKLYYLSVSILVYKITAFKAAYNNEIFYYDTQSRSSNVNIFSLASTTLSQNSLFTGINAFNVIQTGQFIFQFGFSTSGNSLDVSNPNSNQVIELDFFYFVTSPNCPAETYFEPTSNQCVSCPIGQYYDSVATSCQSCSSAVTNCTTCNSTNCFTCILPYVVSTSNTCVINCSAYCSNCILNSTNLSLALCLSCTTGYYVYAENDCITRCGDGYIRGSQGCDDSNTDNGDGCSSSCQIQDYFQCINQPSSCELTLLQMNVVGLTKSFSSNQMQLAVSLFPQNLILYEKIDWLSGVSITSFSGVVTSASYQPQQNRLIVTFNYFEDLQHLQTQLDTSVSSLSPYLASIANVKLNIPNESQNNLILRYYPDQIYNIAKAVKALSIIISSLSLLLFFAGYFGAKLIALQSAAVVQISALLLVTLKNMGPTYEGLKYLNLALGATQLFQHDSFFQNSTVPTNYRTIFSTKNSLGLFNVFLLAIFGPLITAAVFKILSKTKYEGNPLVERMWKLTLGSFTYYGILFLAYGEFGILALDFRHISSSVETGIGIAVCLLFAILYVAYVVMSSKYPLQFGSFKLKFYKFMISKYYYTFSSIERFLSAFLIICLSPGYIASAAAASVLFIQGLFICIKQPYVEGEWKRPLTNKIVAIAICLLYVGSNMTDPSSTINEVIPLIVLLLLSIVIALGIILSISSIFNRYHEVKEKIQKNIYQEPRMTVQEGQSKLLESFEKRIMPRSIEIENVSWKPMIHEDVNINKWRWEQYPLIYSLDRHVNLTKNIKKLNREENLQESNVITIEKKPQNVAIQLSPISLL